MRLSLTGRDILRGVHRSEGQALALFAAGLIGMCGLVGMAVDVGMVVYTRTDLQKAADAAALAGSQDLPSTGAATTSANTYVTENGGSSTSATITFSDTHSANDTITVVTSRHVDYTFLKVLGLSGTTVTATARAQGGPPAPITGYNWAAVAPFVVWGGNRQHEVHQGDNTCQYHTCVGKSYTFMDTNWMSASGNPGTDWSAQSNNFKGDINHGDGAPVSQIGETFSDGGLGNVTEPTSGTFIVVPLVSKATGGSNLRTFTIAAWLVLKVDSPCSKQHCSGTVQGVSVTPPAGWDTSGSVQPPSTLTYKAATASQLIQ